MDTRNWSVGFKKAVLSCVVSSGIFAAQAEAVGWTGNAGDGKWSTPDNWEGGLPPQDGDSVFNLPGGGATEVDVAFTNRNLLIGAEAGAFAFGGTGPLFLAAGLTNLSSSVQSFSVPMTLGETSGAFAVHAAGPLATTGSVQTAVSSLVKTGAGEWATTDSALLNAEDVEVEEGTLRIARRDADARRICPEVWAGTASSGAGNLIWHNVRLADVIGVTGLTGGGSMQGESDIPYTPFFWQNNGTTATVQLHRLVSDMVKVVCLTLTQVGNDVYARNTQAGYGPASKILFGKDLTKTSGWTKTGYTRANSATAAGYGVHNIRPLVEPKVTDYSPDVFAGTSGNGNLVWRNVCLKDVVSVTGLAGGASIAQDYRGSAYTPFHWQHNGTTAKVQFQIIENTTLKVVCVTFTQVGNDVYALNTQAGYATANATTMFGKDLTRDTGWYKTNYTRADSAIAAGYGVYDIRPTLVMQPAGTITVRDGARIDVSQEGLSSASPVSETEATHGKKIYVAGDGPDGAGALYNSADATTCGATFGHIVLTGDASVGGGSMGLCEKAGSAASETSARLEGDHTLTVRNADAAFTLRNVAIDVKKIQVLGQLGIEGELTGTVTDGICLANGSSVCANGGASVSSADIPFTVEDGATVTVETTAAIDIMGAFVNPARWCSLPRARKR